MPKKLRGWNVVNVASHSAPASAQPTAAITKMMRLAVITFTPTDAAASSLSRIACIDEPSRLRSSRKITPSMIAIEPSVSQ